MTAVLLKVKGGNIKMISRRSGSAAGAWYMDRAAEKTSPPAAPDHPPPTLLHPPPDLHLATLCLRSGGKWSAHWGAGTGHSSRQPLLRIVNV